MRLPPTPEASSRRIVGFDVARAVAIAGMVVVHFSLVMAADRHGPGWLLTMLAFLDGRAAATFVVLAGIGITLMSGRAVHAADPRSLAQARKIVVARGLFLLALGFLDLVIWPGDILRVYGVSLLFAAPMITASNRRLLLSAAGFAIGFVVLFLLLDFETHWDWATLTYRELWTPAGLVRNLFYDGFRSVFPWTGLLLLGMWLGRLRWSGPGVIWCVFFVAVATSLGAEWLSRRLVSFCVDGPRGMSRETAVALFGTESMPALPVFLVASGAEALAVIAGCVQITRLGPVRLWQPMVSTGQMALTWYFAHIVLGLGTVVVLELDGSQSLEVASLCGAGFFLAAVLVSWTWKLRHEHGPLEWALRRVTGVGLRSSEQTREDRR